MLGDLLTRYGAATEEELAGEPAGVTFLPRTRLMFDVACAA